MAMKISGPELLSIARQGRPNVRYALNRKGDGIAAWDKTRNRWTQVAGQLINGEWAEMPMELLVNGQPIHQQSDWVE